MSNKIVESYKFITEFECLGNSCPDTCCVNWDMQVDVKTQQLYRDKAPELLSSVTEKNNNLIMKRRESNNACVKLSQGLCSIQGKYNSDYLSDACHFFPRIIRKIDHIITMSASLACPAIVNNILWKDEPFSYSKKTMARLPHNINNYILPSLSGDQALQIHNLMHSLSKESDKASISLAKISTLSYSLDNIKQSDWLGAINSLAPIIGSLAITPEHNKNDPFYLIESWVILTGSAKGHNSSLKELFKIVELTLNISIDYENHSVILQNDSYQLYQDLYANLAKNDLLDHILRKYIETQIIISLYPFAGLGEKLAEKILFISVKFASLRLILLCYFKQHGELSNEAITKIVYSFARFADHLADAKLSLMIYHDFYWHHENRLLGLIQ